MTKQNCTCKTPAECAGNGVCRLQKPVDIRKEHTVVNDITTHVRMASYGLERVGWGGKLVKCVELFADWSCEFEGVSDLGVEFEEPAALAAFLAFRVVPPRKDDRALQWEADNLPHAVADLCLKAMEVGIAAITDEARRTRMAEALAQIMQERRKTIRQADKE